MEAIAWASICVAFACALLIAVDEIRHPQRMNVMNVVWPVTALYFSVFAVWAYCLVGRKQARAASSGGTGKHKHKDGGGAMSPTAWQVAVGTSYCGAGCMIADVLCEFGIAAAGLSLLGSVLWAEFAIDLAAAWALGIVFQYLAIKPMRTLTVPQAIIAAIKADTLSIFAFQVGMYAWMAAVFFKFFPQPHLTAFQPQYWLMMQLAMTCGYATAFPMNWWLIKTGLKEAM
jgi:hypothetical protein